jgi:hypothetical protein
MKPNGRFVRNILMTTDEVPAFREKWNDTGIYITAYQYTAENQAEADLIGDPYFDFDIADLNAYSFEKIREDAIRTIAMFTAIFGIDKDQIEIYFSGKKGVHLVVPRVILGIEPMKDLNEVFRLMAKDIAQVLKHKTMDTRIYDRVRLFRLPNSIHQATGFRKIPLSYNELRTLSIEEIEEMATKPRKPQWKPAKYNTRAAKQFRTYVEKWEKEKSRRDLSNKKLQQKLDFMPPCVKALIHQEAPEGRRNNTCAALASYFKRRGNTEEEAYEKLMRWNQKRCSPMMPAREILTTVKSVYRGQYNYGCTTFYELTGTCSKDCKLYRKRV